jgi:cytochrome b
MSHVEQVKVWDPLVRTFHWSLVVLFTLAYVTGDDAGAVHIWSGYIVLALVVLRVLWGLIGTRYARFSDFLYPAGVILGYARDTLLSRAKRYLGHNPLGGVMILVMLICLLATGVTGYVLERAQQQPAALASYSLSSSTGVSAISVARADDDSGETHRADRHHSRWLKHTHEFFAKLMLLLIFLHLAGVILESRLHGENLVRAMFTGFKTHATGAGKKSASS